LRGQEKVTKEKAARMARLSCASRLCRAGRATARPCAVRDARASYPRPFGLAGKGWRCSGAPYGFGTTPCPA